MLNAAAFEIAYDGWTGLDELRQEGIRHRERAVEVDSELLFERGRIAEIVVERDSGVVYEDVKRSDARSGRADLILVGHVKPDRRRATIGRGSRLAHPGKNVRRTTPQCLGDQRFADTAVRTGDQNCLALECRAVVHFQASVFVSFLDPWERWDPSWWVRASKYSFAQARGPDHPERDECRFDHPAQ
jgi:hypothetical protein